jgi:pimeloyl-ACP methyl ester carboxylesterase
MDRHTHDLSIRSGKARVVFIAGALGSAGDWQGMIDCLGTRAEAFATDAPHALEKLACTGAEAFHVVAEGTAAIEAVAAAARGHRSIASLTLIDPDASVAVPEIASARAFQSGHAMRRRFACFLDEGDAWSAMQTAIDHTMGSGAWARTSFGLRHRLAARCGRLVDAWRAQAAATVTVESLKRVGVPVLSMTGRYAPAEYRATQKAFATTLPRLKAVTIDAAGALTHLTDPHVMGPAIADFVVQAHRQWQHRGTGAASAA